MVTSPSSHDYTLVNPSSSVTVTQPVDTHTNESSVENKICNIKTKVSHLIGNIPHSSSKGIKAAGKYTYEKMSADPCSTAAFIMGIAALVVIVACIAFTLHSYYAS